MYKSVNIEKILQGRVFFCAKKSGLWDMLDSIVKIYHGYCPKKTGERE